MYEPITNRNLHYIKLIDMCVHAWFWWRGSVCHALRSPYHPTPYPLLIFFSGRVTGRGHIDVNRISGYIPGKIVFFLMQARWWRAGRPAMNMRLATCIVD